MQAALRRTAARRAVLSEPQGLRGHIITSSDESTLQSACCLKAPFETLLQKTPQAQAKCITYRSNQIRDTADLISIQYKLREKPAAAATTMQGSFGRGCYLSPNYHGPAPLNPKPKAPRSQIHLCLLRGTKAPGLLLGSLRTVVVPTTALLSMMTMHVACLRVYIYIYMCVYKNL